MQTVTFLSEPKNAKVIVTPIDTFIKTCFSGSNVICGKETLHQYLLDRNVATHWWDLTYNQRKNMGMIIIRNFAPIPKGSGWGDCGCAGTNINWGPCTCGNIANHVKAKLNHIPKYDCVYYAAGWIPGPSGGPTDVHCCAEEEYYLPCYVVGCYYLSPPHAISVLQIGKDEKDWDSWIFFSCTDGLLDFRTVGGFGLARGEWIVIELGFMRSISFTIPESGKPYVPPPP